MSKPGRVTIPCFFLEETDQVEVILRRYAGVPDGQPKCPPMGYHDRQRSVGRTTPAALIAAGWPVSESGQPYDDGSRYPRDHRKWPTHCRCGYQFVESDPWQVQPFQLYRRSDSGELVTLHDAPVGAIWRAPWFEEHVQKSKGLNGISQWTGPDGKCYVCRLPGKDGTHHDWIIDSIASNCDSPCEVCKVPRNKHKGEKEAGHRYVDGHPHKCWVRTGTPPKLDVTKGKPGESCGAGGGSIMTGDRWHGHLRGGNLVGRFE